MKTNLAIRKYTLKLDDQRWREVKAFAAIKGVRIGEVIVSALDKVMKNK